MSLILLCYGVSEVPCSNQRRRRENTIHQAEASLTAKTGALPGKKVFVSPLVKSGFLKSRHDPHKKSCKLKAQNEKVWGLLRLMVSGQR